MSFLIGIDLLSKSGMEKFTAKEKSKNRKARNRRVEKHGSSGSEIGHTATGSEERQRLIRVAARGEAARTEDEPEKMPVKTKRPDRSRGAVFYG